MKTHFLPQQLIQCKTVELDNEDKDSRLVKIYASDETPIERFSYDRWERYILVVGHETSEPNFDRVRNGVCLFFENHPGLFSDSKRLGKVVDSQLIDKKLILTLKLNRSPEADRYLQDVEDGTEPGNSIGLVVNKIQVIKKAVYEIDDDGYRTLKEPMVARAVDWELQEVSAVSIPANPNAGTWTNEKFNSSIEKFPVEILGDTGYEQSEGLMSKPNTPTEPVNEELDQLKAKLSKVTLAASYWKLRSRAIDLYALQNKLIEEEFKLDFSDSPEADLEKLYAMEPEDAAIELKTIDRTLIRAANKQPINRLDDKDKEIISNGSISANLPDGLVTKSKHESSPDGRSSEEFAAELMRDF